MDIGKELAIKGLDILNNTQAFVIEQAPDFIQQLIAWQYAVSIAGVILCVIISITIFMFVHLLAKRTKDIFAYIFNMFQVVPLVFGIDHGYNLIQIHYAPKIFLLEYFAKLVK